MNDSLKSVYLALGDSMSIDDYTGVVGGGAVAQFHRKLGPSWHLVDRTCDGCTIALVPVHDRSDIITLTIGGNDGLINLESIIANGVSSLLNEHRRLLTRIRQHNPDAILIVGNVYEPQMSLPELALRRLSELNEGIRENVATVDGRLADIHSAFRGHGDDLLCQNIEPSLAGATRIAELFWEQYQISV